jgi:hypothetical protein
VVTAHLAALVMATGTTPFDLISLVSALRIGIVPQYLRENIYFKFLLQIVFNIQHPTSDHIKYKLSYNNMFLIFIIIIIYFILQVIQIQSENHRM